MSAIIDKLFKARENELIDEFLAFAKEVKSYAERYFKMDEKYQIQVDTIDPIIYKTGIMIEEWEEKR